MIVSGVLAQQALLVAGGGTPWTPLNMAAVPQIYLDMQDSTVTNVSGAASAVSNLGALGVNGDFVQATAGNRPAILAAELYGKRVLRFDGSNDVLTCGTTAGKDILRNVSSAWAVMVYKKRSADISPTTRYSFYVANGTGAARFALLSGTNTTGQENHPNILAGRLDADAAVPLRSANSVSGSYAIVVSSVDYATGEGLIRENGASSAFDAALIAVTGSTSNTASSVGLSLGARVTGTLASDIDIAVFICGSVQPAAGEIEKIEGWAAHKYGLTASLPGGHPYKSAAPTVSPPPAIGAYWSAQSGWYVGDVTISGNNYHMVFADKAAEFTNQWKTTDTATTMSGSTGKQLTDAMIAAGSHPAAIQCRAYTAGGFSDWSMQSLDEIYAIYTGTLRPDTTSNPVWAYGGAQAPDNTDYWSAAQGATTSNGYKAKYSSSSFPQEPKTTVLRVRPARLIPV